MTYNTKGFLLGKPFVLRKNLNHNNLSSMKLFHILLNLVVRNDCLFENIGTGLLRTNHLDALGKLLTHTGFQGCDYFLCHNSSK